MRFLEAEHERRSRQSVCTEERMDDLMTERIDVREEVVNNEVFDRCLAAGLDEAVALQKATEAVHAWRDRDNSDQQLPRTFARDWPI